VIDINSLFKDEDNVIKSDASSGIEEKAVSEDVLNAINAFKKEVWIPVTEQSESDSIASKFSGMPALQDRESWPLCGHCSEPMQLFLQLNSEELPDSVKDIYGGGLLQVFYCTNDDKGCELECESYYPFSKSTLVRVIEHENVSSHSINISPVKNEFPEKKIVEWVSRVDYPSNEELELLGCELEEEEFESLSDYHPLPKDKLLGWPLWIQGIEYPDCPKCNEPMSFIFQIDSEDNVPYMFSDSGCSHITQCKEHKDQLAIAWACG
jgi:uncharacterized protein YwqG